MAKFKVEIKSKDMIKPLSPTPNHLKNHQLSFIDKFAPPVLMPFIFFYNTPFNYNNSINSQTTTKLLKKSLSETLVQFYPLAGRIEGNLSINCNDEGAEFYEADVLASLAEVIVNPDPDELIRLLPYATVRTNTSIVTAVQVNRFSCGGMAISVCISHKIGDATTDIAFINTWGRNARGGVSDSDDNLVTFDSTPFLTPMDLNGIFDPESVISKKKIVTRRLVFDKEKLDELKKQYDDGQLGSPPTRVTAVYAFLWNKLIKIARAKPTPPKISSASIAVNLRAIRGSPIPNNCYGNLYWIPFAHTSIESENTETIVKLKTVLKQNDMSLLRKIKTGECLLEFQEAYTNFSKRGIYFCSFSSLIRMPLYEVNFGWGTPLWVSQTTLPFKNNVILFSTKCGQGIEAWVHVLDEYVAMLDQDQEIHPLASHCMRAKL
ncbi:stemmadenine O-acetyltransferase-like [Silene latifolia]|uniref:stemmadenine O-acetyltransferase-like n=1 Tax=Silene latifolia TaxID=37657 RepID=UPI003D7816D2